MKKVFLTAFLALIIIGASNQAMALWGREFRVAADVQYDFMTGGRIGQFEGANFNINPNLDGFYKSGMGFRAEVGYAFRTNWEFLVGAGYFSYPGRSKTVLNNSGEVLNVKLSKFEGVPLYLGWRFLFSEEPRKGFCPYLRLDTGAMIINEVKADISYANSSVPAYNFNFSGTWWRRTASFMWDAGVGAQYSWNKYSVFFEAMYFSPGRPAGPTNELINGISLESAGTRWGPVSANLGFAYYF